MGPTDLHVAEMLFVKCYKEATVMHAKGMSKVDIVRTHFEVENIHDMAAMLATLRDEDPIREEIAGKTYVGQKAVADRYRALWDAFPDFNVTPTGFTENEKTVVAEAIYSGTHKGVFNGFQPKGRSFKLSIVVVFRFDSPTSSKITSESIYLDYASHLRQLGLMEI
jgi:steroid delta-isomerase-like uncharacterized protein